MNKREYAKLKKWTDTLTDEELKKEYYDEVFDALGSQAEVICSTSRSDMLEMICSERGIELWEEYAEKKG